MGFIGQSKSGSASKTSPFNQGGGLPVQTKLSVSKASDPAEKEADTVAKKVVDDQKDKKSAAKKDDKKEVAKAPEPMTEPNTEPKKEGVKTKKDNEKDQVNKAEDKKEDVKKKGDEKEMKKKGEEKEVKKKGEEKEMKKKGEEKEVKKKGGEEKEVRKKGEEKEVKKKGQGEEKEVKKKGEEKEVKKKGEEKEVKKKGEEKEKPKVAKKGAGGEDKKDAVAKKDENNKEKKPVDKEKDTSVKPRSLNKKEDGKKEPSQVQQKPNFSNAQRAENDKGQGPEAGGDEMADEAKLNAIEQKINAKRGSGRPLEPHLMSQMNDSFGYDFSEVKIHADKEAAELCASLNAQAFAIGNDVFFNEGKYDPDSDSGKELLAHELTHVVQQRDQVQRAKVQRKDPPGKKGGSGSKGRIEGKEIILPSLEVPQFKARNKGKYGSSIKRKFPYSRKAAEGSKGQTAIWTSDPKISEGVKKGVESLKKKAGKKNDSPDVYFLKWKEIKLFGTEQTLIENSKRPLWNASGAVSAFDVDHIVELQLVGGENTIDNMELVNFSGNRSSGSLIAGNIEKGVQEFITDTNQSFSLDHAFTNFQISFESISFTGKTEKSTKGGGKDGFWSRDQIEGGEHLENFTKMSEKEIEQLSGTDKNPVAYTSPAGGARMDNQSLNRMPGFSGSIVLDKSGDRVGYIQGKFELNKKLFEPLDNIKINLFQMPGVDFGGHMKRRTRGDDLETVLSNLKLKGMSPIEIESAELVPGKGIVAKGKIIPTVGILGKDGLDISIIGQDVEISKTFYAGDITVPPPFKINDASLTIFAGTAGIGVRGDVNFEIVNVGKGTISGEGKSSGVFAIKGNFEFDKKIFDKASVDVSYVHGADGSDKWEIKGNIQIPKGKIKGVKKAEITVGYDGTTLSASGTAEFDIPGIKSGKLDVVYGQDQLQINGEVDIKHQLIKSGKIKASVNKTGEEYKVALSGNVQPNIPGISTDLSVEYVDGVITVMGTVGYAKGRLSGSVTVGVTNRSVGADGKPAGGPSESLTPFGGGSLTLRITDWLQGTAGVKLLPDGSLEVTGKIGIPATVDIFEKKEIKKEIFKAPTIEIPIFAIPIGSRSIGLVATIGGGLEGYASIGPGQLTEAAVEVTYNPSHEENTKVTGTAKFRVPAEAGLRLYIRAGIGLSVGIARVAGGIEIGGALGIEGAAEAGVTVNWTPTEGFKLDAQASLSVQPKFKFDVNAYIEAVLDLWVTELSKEWKWNLYSFEWGPAFKFGVKFPVHYEEGKEFNISLDDVQFEKPDISVGDIAKGIGDKLLG